MRRLLRTLLPALVAALLSWAAPSTPPRVAPTTDGRELIDLLPESAVIAVEIDGLSRRWAEIRALPGLARFQDRVLGELGLEANDLPLLVGDRAVVALLASEERRELWPVALLRPPLPDVAEALLASRAGDAAIAVPAFAVGRAGDTLWVVPAEAADRLDRLTRAGSASRAEAFHLVEVARQLPGDGLVRGWLDARGLRELLMRRTDGSRPPLIEWMADLAVAELGAVQAAGFRRDLERQGVATDSIWTFHDDLLPVEVARALASRPGPARLPADLPAGVVAISAFRTEPEASLAWLRHVATRDPRGSLRNLDFWIGEFEARFGRDVERDLPALLGEHGWAMLFEDAYDGSIEIAAACEVRDADGIEGALLDLRTFLMEHTLGRTLGMVVPREREDRLDGHALHGTTLRTLFGEVNGPVFLVTDEHALVATGDAALHKALRLLEDASSWAPVELEGGLPSPPHEALRVRVATLAPLVERWLAARGPETRAARLAEAVSELLTGFDLVEMGIWYDDGAIRAGSHARFASP